jgi:hypothetical protein
MANGAVAEIGCRRFTICTPALTDQCELNAFDGSRASRHRRAEEGGPDKVSELAGVD